jgi:hypothetical protein
MHRFQSQRFQDEHVQCSLHDAPGLLRYGHFRFPLD